MGEDTTSASTKAAATQSSGSQNESSQEITTDHQQQEQQEQQPPPPQEEAKKSADSGEVVQRQQQQEQLKDVSNNVSLTENEKLQSITANNTITQAIIEEFHQDLTECVARVAKAAPTPSAATAAATITTSKSGAVTDSKLPVLADITVKEERPYEGSMAKSAAVAVAVASDQYKPQKTTCIIPSPSETKDGLVGGGQTLNSNDEYRNTSIPSFSCFDEDIETANRGVGEGIGLESLNTNTSTTASSIEDNNNSSSNDYVIPTAAPAVAPTSSVSRVATTGSRRRLIVPGAHHVQPNVTFPTRSSFGSFELADDYDRYASSSSDEEDEEERVSSSVGILPPPSREVSNVTTAGATSINSAGDYLVEAKLVTEESNRNIDPSLVEAHPVKDDEHKRTCRMIIGIAIMIITIIAIVVVRLQVGKSKERNDVIPTLSPTSSPTASPIPVLQSVKESGVLRCGLMKLLVQTVHVIRQRNVTNLPFEIIDENMCRAIAAAILGADTYEIEVVAMERHERLPLLINGTVDILLERPDDIVQNDIYHADYLIQQQQQQDEEGGRTDYKSLLDTGDYGFSFSVPYMYDGLVFGGIPHYIENCIDDNIKTFFECSDIKICVGEDSRYHEYLASKVPGRHLLPVPGTSYFSFFMKNECNVVAHESIALGEDVVRFYGYDGPYKVSNTVFAKDIFVMETRHDDPIWTDFVNTVFMGLLAAEKRNITQATAVEFGQYPDLFGSEYSNMFVDAIQAVGNYREIYSRTLEPLLTHDDWNYINMDDNSEVEPAGLLFAPQFETKTRSIVEDDMAGPIEGGTLSKILDREYVNCAIRTNRLGFAFIYNSNDNYSSNHNATTTATTPATTSSISSSRSSSGLIVEGMDADYCRLISAGLFQGDPDRVKFIPIYEDDDDSGNYTSGYQALASGEVDVLAGGIWTIQNDVNETTTGVGYSFSQPYFYGPSNYELSKLDNDSNITFDENLCLVTRQDDPQFTSFVYWMVSSTLYAEEMNVQQRQSNEMPSSMGLFGFNLEYMFSDGIHAIGNYAEIYERHLDSSGNNGSSILPRGGRNRINSATQNRGPQHYVIPGL